MTSRIAQKSKPLPAGIYCPVLSLYKSTPRQEIDYEASYKYFAYLIRGGVDGLVMAGTTAEAVLLSATERQELVRVARRAASDLGFPDFPVVAGISGQSTNESIQLAKDANEAGGDFGLLLPPSYWVKAVTKDVIVDFYREVADNSPIPIVIYSVRTLWRTALGFFILYANSAVPCDVQRGRSQLGRHVGTGAASQHHRHEADLWQRRQGHPVDAGV